MNDLKKAFNIIYMNPASNIFISVNTQSKPTEDEFFNP